MNQSRQLYGFQIWKTPLSGHFYIIRENSEWITRPMANKNRILVAQFTAPSLLAAHLSHFGSFPTIDRTIKPLVLLLNELGYMTEFSCSGHRALPEGYIALFADSTQSARNLMRAVGALEDEWNDEHDVAWPPVSVRVEVICHRWEMLGHEDEWHLRLGFKPSGSRPITAANYTWLIGQLLEKLVLPACEKLRLWNEYFTFRPK